MKTTQRYTQLVLLLILLATAAVLSGCGHQGMGHRYNQNNMHNQQNTWNHAADRQGYGTTHGPY